MNNALKNGYGGGGNNVQHLGRICVIKKNWWIELQQKLLLRSEI